MDNYYKKRTEQFVDNKGYKNFDLPTSFEIERFITDLERLIENKSIHIPLYDFNNDHSDARIEIIPKPIIVVDGLFIYYFEKVKRLLDYKVMVLLSFEESFKRRLKRDQEERNYKVEEINHRYINHAEPAYQQFIQPFSTEMDLLINNDQHIKSSKRILFEKIESILNNSKSARI